MKNSAYHGASPRNNILFGLICVHTVSNQLMRGFLCLGECRVEDMDHGGCADDRN
jgi:hypothetical protein